VGKLTVAVACLACALAVQAEPVHLKGLSGKVQVYYDTYDIPHVYAGSWKDAAMTLGYIHASQRLWEMDFMRRYASGNLAQVAGKRVLPHDIEMRRLGIRRTSQDWWESGSVPAQFRAELEAYASGVNRYIDEIKPDQLSPLFEGHKPAHWSPVDSICFMKYMGWDQGGSDDDLWLGMMVDKMGIEAVEALWPLNRPYEIATVKKQVNRDDLNLASLKPIPGTAGAYEAAFDKMETAGWLDRGLAFGSNNWAIDGTKTKSGKPILCSDPHLGFRLPALWYAAHICVNGKSVAGTMFPTAPYIVIGHNDRIGWGITNMQADAVDYFVETMNPDNPMEYKHRGKWLKVKRITETIPVKGEAPQTVNIDYTIHGPIISREGKTISMDWAGLGETKDGLAIWMLNRAQNLKQALAALDNIIVPALNIAYADVDGNIAIHPCGALPIRLGGQGRIPMDGASGENDWQGFIPRNKLPLAVNPADHYIASANGRPQPVGYPFYLGYQWDPSYRTRRIADMLLPAHDMTVDKMKAVQNDVHDKAAERFLPVMIAAIAPDKLTDPFARKVYDAIKGWNYVARGTTRAPTIWHRWFNAYRKDVWDDEWKVRDIKQPGGSWGFTGDNHREPMLEVLEFMTREKPNSKWFDDHTTPQVETRDDIIKRAFREAVASLNGQSKGDLSALDWDKLNILYIRHSSGVKAYNRNGGPVPGDGFTVNPGSEGGHVGGGASSRYIVDFANPSGSICVYPGGESGNPDSPHYDDLMKLWAKGQYAPLYAFDDASKLPQAAKKREMTFTP